MKHWFGEIIFQFFDWLDGTERGFDIMAGCYAFGSIFATFWIGSRLPFVEETQVKIGFLLLALFWTAPFIVIWRIHVRAKVRSNDLVERSTLHETPDTVQNALTDEEKTALEVLDLDYPYTLTELKKRRKSLIAKIHPDQGGTSFLLRQVEDAFQLLKAKM